MMQEHEHEELVSYLGKQVPRRGFRAFIYATDGRQKIAESYDEFDLYTHSDEWFATKEEAMAPKKIAMEEPKETVKPRKKTEG
jgi:hypothetical protein